MEICMKFYVFSTIKLFSLADNQTYTEVPLSKQPVLQHNLKSQFYLGLNAVTTFTS